MWYSFIGYERLQTVGNIAISVLVARVSTDCRSVRSVQCFIHYFKFLDFQNAKSVVRQVVITENLKLINLPVKVR